MSYRVILFVFFSLLAAPLEYHVKWAEPWVKGKVAFLDALNQPLVSGMLFFYAVIITVEALMHLATYPQIATKPVVRLMRIIGYLLSGIPFFFYVLRGPEQPLSDEWLPLQWYVAAASLFLALSIRFYTARVERYLREPI
jgi:hypothetical protein